MHTKLTGMYLLKQMSSNKLLITSFDKELLSNRKDQM